jgi:hypothetical protein
MIWRLMASILTLSEPGGATLSTNNSDWPDQFQCDKIIHDFYTAPPPQVVNGKKITIKIAASCVPVSGELPPADSVLPPPVYDGPPPQLGKLPYPPPLAVPPPLLIPPPLAGLIPFLGLPHNYGEEDYDVMRPPPRYVVVPRYMPNGSRMLAPPCGGRLPCDY